jgi:uncharacterized protein (TIGR03546 family)
MKKEYDGRKMLKAIVKLFKSLNANSHPGEIAHALCLGVLLGLMPKDNALWYILTVFFLFMRINRGVLVLIAALFTLIAPPFDPLLDSMGYAVLMFAPLVPVFRALLDIPFVAFTKINNTVVVGSIVASLIAYIPLYVLSRLAVRLWRMTVAPKIMESKLYKAFMRLPLAAKIADAARGPDEL